VTSKKSTISDLSSKKKKSLPIDIDYSPENIEVDDDSVISSFSRKKKRPLSLNATKGSPTRKKDKKAVSIDEVLIEYTYKREQQVEEAAIEVKRHNQTMESIAMSTSSIEKT
jgi:hypothetical protein